MVGYFQLDSVRELEDLRGLEHVHTVEGQLNIFRSPGFETLRGLDSLETIEGNLYIHLNENLASLIGLEKLRTITGNLHIAYNPKLPQADIDELVARVQVGGTTTLYR